MNINKELDRLLKLVEKPARYIGAEVNSITKNVEDDLLRFGFAFPDTYEIGMSYMGLQILYSVINSREKLFCERVFAPASDMEALMRERNVPLFTLETKTPLRELDAIGFTLQYEMSFTNILNMLELAGIPLLASDRTDEDPLVIVGGPCAYNPEPLADFVDIVCVGDGEEMLPALLEKIYEAKKNAGGAGKGAESVKDTKIDKKSLLRAVSGLQGIYVPSFYNPIYGEDGTIVKYEKLWDGAPDRVLRAIVKDLDSVQFPTDTIVPFIDIVHDRAVVETFRGCTRGCRFCQAGMIYRPVRERSEENILELAKAQLRSTGHEELSILSLSTSDYSKFESLATHLMQDCAAQNVSLSLPSLRLDSFSFKVLEEIQKYKKSGLTFAPEAGTQRLRDIINKGVTEKDIYDSTRQAIELGWNNIKLYFMCGLPGETYEDLDGIAEIARNIVETNREIKGGKGGRFNVTVSVSNFVPKSHTPFQWFAQNTQEEFTAKHEHLKEKLKIKNVTFNYHETDTSMLEAVFARGDRRTGKLLLRAHELGCKFDAWAETFKYELWQQAFADTGISADFYAHRQRSYDEFLPWEIIDSGISKEFLQRENEKSARGETTKDCRRGCAGCGINRYTTCPMGGVLANE